MKNTIKILCVVLAYCSLMRAQDSLRKSQLGVDLSFAKPSFVKNGFLPSVTFSWNKQIVFAGPAIIRFDANHSQNMLGAHAGYRIFPNGRNKRFNLFFQYDLLFVKGTIKDNVNYWVYQIPSGQGTRTKNMVSLDNYVGFGFRWNVFKNLYFLSNVGVGLGLYKTDYTYNYSNGDSWTGKGSLVLRDPLNQFNRMFKLGIGYDLMNLKMK